MTQSVFAHRWWRVGGWAGGVSTALGAIVLVASLLATARGAGAPAEAPAAIAADPSAEPQAAWIWSNGPAEEGQIIFFRTTFEVPVPAGQVISATLWAAGDDQVRVYLNAKQVGASDAWKEPVVVGVKPQLRPGTNALCVAVKNLSGAAGLMAKLVVELPEGKKVTVATDNNAWLTSRVLKRGWGEPAYDARDWPRARLVGRYGAEPWGDVAKVKPPTATPAEELKLLPGFAAELLHTVPKGSQGSWVSLADDPKGRLYVSDQSGALFRVTVGARAADTRVEEVRLPLGFAQGLLWAHGGLYVVVNGSGMGGHSSGLYRATDSNGDDVLDRVEALAKFAGEGEHGPHAVRLGPDGKLYVTAGNFTRVPAELSASSPHRNYAEDLLLPRNPDGGGHDPTVWAPGGWVARCDKDGKGWELVAAGLRNAYDFDFNADGEMFTYDSDMEWDVGAPWYRPTRVNHVVSGAEFGWRNGTGKWPDFYADSFGAVVNTGLSSPTGVTFGTGAKFPAKYQRALLVQDWAYGFIYAVHLTEEGASYKGTFEPLVSGKGLPLTDMVINADGHLYFITGGRGLQSGLYRVRYVGSESTAPTQPGPDPAAAEARALRRRLEALHGKADLDALPLILEHLGSQDRAIRYAARVALESQPPAAWRDKALAETRATASIHAMIALVRASAPVPAGARPPVLGPTADPAVAKELAPKVMEALGRLNLRTLSEEQVLDALRAYGLCFIRLGRPDEVTARTVGARLDVLYPHPNPLVSRELANVLAYLGHPGVVGKTLAWMKAGKTQEDQIHALLALRVVRGAWTPDERKAYFAAVAHAERSYKGGASFRKFMQRIGEDARRTLTTEEHVALAPFFAELERSAPPPIAALPPRQFVRNWQMQDLLPELGKASSGRDFARGKAAYDAAQCASCHRFNNEGGATGPDLTGAGNRLSPTDLLENVIHPSRVISDQYQTTELVLRHDVVVGRVEMEDDATLVVRTHPLAPETVTVRKKDIKTRRPGRLSMMPEGLLDILTKEEVLDLIAYLRSGGNPQDPAFRK